MGSESSRMLLPREVGCGSDVFCSAKNELDGASEEGMVDDNR